MPGKIDARLQKLNISLPPAPAPAANYVPFVIAGDLVFVSGQISQDDGGPIKGRLGENMDVAAGQAAARTCSLALIAQVKEACGGDLDRVEQVVRLGGFVNSAPSFTDQPEVVNGASDLIADVFGDAGRHARAAVGSVSLPRGVAVEIEAVVKIR